SNPDIAFGAEFGGVVEDEVNLGEGGVALRRQCRGAAGDDDAGVRVLAAGAADCLARLALGLGGDGAGVDDHRIAQPGLSREPADDIAFESVEAAAEADDLDRGHRPAPARSAGSNVPSKASAAGPVMMTWPSSRQFMSRAPPSSMTLARRPVRLRRDAATSAAQAPVPPARVMPAPRSQTRRRVRRGSRNVATPIPARAGNSLPCSSWGPRAAKSIRSASGTKDVACGLPIFLQP